MQSRFDSRQPRFDSRPSFGSHRIFGVLVMAFVLTLAAVVLPGSAADRLNVRTTATPFARAGVLGGSNAYDDYTLRAPGGSVLFATAAANFYQTNGRRPGEEECGEEPTATPSAGGGDDDGEDHGKELLCLQLLDESGAVLCFAERPSQPGWQRDPRLACPIDGDAAVTANYVLRVSYADTDCGDGTYPAAPTKKDGSAVVTPYQLDGSLQSASGDGPLF